MNNASNKQWLCRSAWAGVLLGLLSACGGGDSAEPSTDVATNPERQSAFVADYTQGLKVLDTYAGLASAAFADLFDAGFLDAGNTKALVSASLAQEAAAMAASPDLPSFPMVGLSTATISACDSSNVCTLTGTLSNNDVDASADNTTSITFTSRVKYSDGKFRLLGDGAAS